MDDRKLNFGPRYDADMNWVCPDGSPADDEDVGLEATIDEDGCMRLAIGGKLERQELELSPQDAAELTAFFYEAQMGGVAERSAEIRHRVEVARQSILRGARRTDHRFKL